MEHVDAFRECGQPKTSEVSRRFHDEAKEVGKTVPFLALQASLTARPVRFSFFKKSVDPFAHILRLGELFAVDSLREPE